MDGKPAHMLSFHLNINHPMDPLRTFVWDGPLSLPRPTGGISVDTFNLLSNPKFYGEGNVFAFTHLKRFDIA